MMKSHITATQSAKSGWEISASYLKLAEGLSPAAGPPILHFYRPWKSQCCVALYNHPACHEMPRACCFAHGKLAVER